MIPKTQASNHLTLIEKSEGTPQWSQELGQALRNPLEICQRLNLNPEDLPGGREGLEQGHQLFSSLVPLPFLERMEKGNPKDPLLLQVLPALEEQQKQPGFVTDPLQEKRFNPLPGLIHKYRSRVLLTLSGGCAVNCRYCFRRHFPYAENTLSKAALQKVIAYLQEHPEINEVIFSGGDPLATPDTRLSEIVSQLEQLPQLKRLRIHSRLPVVLPSRVDAKLLSWLKATRLQTILVLHINHPQELDQSLIQALHELRTTNSILLNQTVLLKGINANAAVLTQLSEQLFAAGVLPYYLHTLDPVQGAAHFAIQDQEAKEIYAELLANLPGYLVPKLVREYADQLSKTPLGW
ncbi:L-lysine 2,3-aminomutase [Marinospirillum celere]|uniref:L-lysine 2,3-aminomutase n=1 Tax=Marinospirillum celere TaxID=1122252 RepID=A0A1I1GNZ5_9GAMM|nr:EF-P beta-lysylation protein EpmB [Marinospirillum celere]SFC13489.1 L-lysine 2,3-aminomutase [Marinospirillum celere]